jgi:superfamily II DNA/RNA helicase
MNVFKTHSKIVEDYASYISSFINIADKDIKAKVDEELNRGKLWPEPLLQFNPSFEIAGGIETLAKAGSIHPEIPKIFKGYSLYSHQVAAIELGLKGKDFVVTSGTGSGKSLTYIGTIFHKLLTEPSTPGVTAVIVYPMNALINSQFEEFSRYKKNYEDASGKPFPIIFGQYTGQESEEQRSKMRENPPQILLTNYMMLELLLTRVRERPIRDAIYDNLKFLVFDELHTYRGRQGADIAMLIRRIRAQCKHELTCIGTSATMVSVGSLHSQQEEVARVAETLFGRPFAPSQVVNEKLARSLSPSAEDVPQAVLSDAMRKGIDVGTDVSQLKQHPVARWLENKIALRLDGQSLVRGKPQRISSIIQSLANDSGESEELSREMLVKLLQWISTVNKKLQDSGQRYTILPFRLHQFISQTGSVYTTLDQDENRFITLEPGLYKQDEADKKPIFPNVFSRASGYPFICVTRVDDRLEPREFRESGDDDDLGTDGYLIIGDDVWSPEEDLDYLPDAWFRRTKQGLVPDSKKKAFFPSRIYFDEYGNCSDSEPLKWSGWFMKAPLLFDPTAGVFFETKTSEGTKLTKLGSEGRSTSTTITAFSILNQLNEAGYQAKDQKLLSFTDNRQDAALQAGHFNDFVQVIRLRGGIFRALSESQNKLLTYATLGEAVGKSLNLPFLEFANKNEEPALATVRRNYEEALQSFITYRALSDLRRSWRIVLPNLEQCGLLSIEYADLPEIAATDTFWADTPILDQLDHNERQTFIETILDFFRLEFAIHSENFLTHSKLKENAKEFREKLRAPWTLERNEELMEPYFIRFEALHPSARFYAKSVGPASGLGKFIKQFAKYKGIEVDLRSDHYAAFIRNLLGKLEEADYLKSQIARNVNNEDTPIYRLKIEKIVWKLGDGEKVKADLIKQRSYKSQQRRPNIFFRDLYRSDFTSTKRMRGADHTGQLNSDLRIEREEKFREGEISALFCSPTMELGIDIGGLSVVHLRNSPPNAANYAQRSGRAGRSGQGALVFTYCSSYSPHDRHYFQQQAELVSGSVQAPRLDLCNKELLLTHLNALTISEIGLPKLEQDGAPRPSLMALVQDDNDRMALKSEVIAGLQIPPQKFMEIKGAFQRVISDFAPKLAITSKSWFSDQWVEQNLAKLSDSLDSSLNRWRSLYRSARGILSRATQRIESGTLGLGSDEYRKQKRNQDQATRQLDLLRNDAGGRAAELSEFYPYRYLAAEGFLPGYNFTRLPIRVFLPTSDSSGDFISRPRSVALREFGPLNIIYYNGRKYKVSQAVVQDAESNLTEAKVSTKAGYFLTGDQKDREICPFTGLSLGDNANREHLHFLLEMTESRAEETDRISCEEEERVSKGFEIETYFTMDGGDLGRIRRAVLRTNEAPLMNLRYLPAARLVHLNRKWRYQQAEGFPMGLVSGDWRSSIPAPETNPREEFRAVKLWTSTVADALYIEPTQPLGLTADGVITLQYALKRAIEALFQVESNEISVVAVGDQESPNILIYEAAEGSLGVLSQFVDDITVFHSVVRKAVALCRYDDQAYKGPASYDDLLSYYNQRDHKSLDRHLIKGALEKLLVCTIERLDSSSYESYEEHYQAMQRNLDPNSSTERTFLKYLYENGLRLPDEAQKRVDGIYCQPDFYYHPRFWVFCDGTPHDEPAVQADDKAKRDEIIAKGDEVWVYHYRENLAERIASRPDVFRKAK